MTCESVQGVTIDPNYSLSPQRTSDENKDGFTCQQGYVLTGIGCSGDNCDNLDLTCSKYNAKVTIELIDAAYKWVGIGSTTLRAERTLSDALSDAKASSSQNSWGISSTVEAGFSGDLFSGGASVTTSMSQAFQSSVSSSIERSSTQLASMTRSIQASTECGDSNGVVYQYGFKTTDSANGISHFWENDFVCSLQNLPPPKCTPQDCGNVHSVVLAGIPPGCQCCKAETASALLPGKPVC